MALTETQLARALRRGELNVDGALYLFERGEVNVYPGVELDPETTMYDDVEDQAFATSSLFADLRNLGATEADLAEIGVQIQRARNEGRTIEAAPDEA